MAPRRTRAQNVPKTIPVGRGARLTRSSRGRRLILIMLLVSRASQGQSHANAQLWGDDLQGLRVEPLGVDLHVAEGVGHFAGHLEVLGEVLHQTREPRAAAT